ncbi:putative PHO84-inorganic phosphate permease [Tilletiaria anomala UBC 951]|uniref:Putative PHO84-inorganic phosphate permease n=1 Tax=Tilletiaria anomala (strain ATCC 24038 / CBS 436.72 / UBC 951) TaxID=1037660 RepID=A0A066WEQ1_TILAU|nr:putative PHO84-inorganic phosphate permease [Tilletiaria anomala UBC 951]KDN52241.1 putative PHO84-inorganic phosphate permease [Tilletiaria anomala UBC 951]
MPFGADLDAYHSGAKGNAPLALVEKKEKAFLGITLGEVKLLSIAGVGFMMDAYDLFIINMMYAVILLAYFPDPSKGAHHFKSNVDWGLNGGVLKASANIGNVIGQVAFGLLGDSFGRSAVYGKELIIVIVAIIIMISAPNYLGPDGVTKWIFGWRLVMGIGIGGDYPMSAAVVSDRAHLKKRGFLLSWIFSNQGWGNLVGAVVAVVVIAAYRGPVVAGDYARLTGAWRVMQGLALVPAFAVLYFRLTLVESTRFTQARRIQDDPEILAQQGMVAAPVDSDDDLNKKPTDGDASDVSSMENQAVGLKFTTIGKKAHNEFIEYFSEWRHLKILIGTSLAWFLVDITFYGINLNTSTILSAIGFTNGAATPEGQWSKLMRTATGNLIITVAGFLPGYFFTMATIERIGRKPIQLVGFLLNALFLGILAGTFHWLKKDTAGFFVVFVFLQLFFNFGPNATTFIIPAEAFPTRVRAGAHGISAACGKCGAILASLGFSAIASQIGGDRGTEVDFWIFVGISILGAIVTYFLVPETKGRDADLIDREELAAKADMGPAA